MWTLIAAAHEVHGKPSRSQLSVACQLTLSSEDVSSAQYLYPTGRKANLCEATTYQQRSAPTAGMPYLRTSKGKLKDLLIALGPRLREYTDNDVRISRFSCQIADL